MESNLDILDDSRFLFVSGRLCLDFVNTEIMQEGLRADLTPDWDAMSDWLTAAGLLTSELPANFRQLEREEALETALDLRMALRTLAESLSEAAAVPQAALETINRVLAQNRGVRQVVQEKATGTYTERFVNEGRGFISLLSPIAQDASDLLCNGEPTLVRQCENPQCILFFYDTTKYHKRRWCRMSACGNRAKAAAHYQRQKLQK
ncbi:MAG: ABATE domain-containing protein [Armatimonadota bacterium]